MLWLLSLVLGCPAPPGTHTTATDSAQDTAAPAPSAVTAAVDPEIASLVWVAWTQPADAGTQEAVVEWSLPGEAVQTTPPRTAAPGPQQLVVLGVPFEATAAWRLLLDGAEVASGTVTTGAPPLGVPRAVLLGAGDAAGQDPALRYLLTSVSSSGYRWPTWTVIVDRQGRLVWARQTPDYFVTMHPRIAADGRSLLIDENSFWGAFDVGAASVVQRLTLDGTVAETIALPGLHHAYTQLPDGTMVWGAARDGGETEVLMARAPDGTLTEVWSCAAFFAALGEARPCGSNTVSWHAAGDTILYSLYSVETVVEVDWRAGTALRWFGHLPGAWAFAEAETAFWWQHGAQYTPEGTLLVSARTAPGVDETVVREYALDEATQTLQQIWSFGEGEGVYGAKMGEPWRLPSGNILHNYGSTPRVREATADGGVVWDVGWTSLAFIGRSIPLEDLYVFLPP